MSNKRQPMGDEILNLGLEKKEEAFLKGNLLSEESQSAIDRSSNVLQQIIDESKSEKEPTVRITVDLPKSMHQELSIFCAQTGKSKAEIIRLLLHNALNAVKQ